MELKLQAKCPHCDRNNLFMFDEVGHLQAGDQYPQVITCSHDYKVNSWAVTTAYGGCGEHFVVIPNFDISVTTKVIVDKSQVKKSKSL